MKLTLVQFFAVLAPSIVCAVLGFVVVVVPCLKQFLESFFRSSHKVEWLKEHVAHGGVYGGVIAALFGIEKSSHGTVVFATIWFVCMCAVSYVLALRLEALEEMKKEHESVQSSINAELIRSIVRSELDKPIETKKGRHKKSGIRIWLCLSCHSLPASNSSISVFMWAP